MSEDVTQRLFFALWPGAEVREGLARLSRQHAGKTGKPVRVENLHITLAFLGPVGLPVRECIEAGADTVQGRSFTFVLNQMGWWPRPRVLWTGPSEVPEALSSLVGDLKQLCQNCGLEPERRPYRAHLTLARKVGKAPRSQAIEAIQWPVNEFCLVQSRTLPTGAEYAVLRTWPLS